MREVRKRTYLEGNGNVVHKYQLIQRKVFHNLVNVPRIRAFFEVPLLLCKAFGFFY